MVDRRRQISTTESGMKNDGFTFSGFAPESFEFFRDLAQNNTKGWFEQNRSCYDERVVGAFRALLATLEPSLLRLHPCFETAGKTNRNFSRINRDIRFSKDKSPYKPNYYLYVFDRRRDRALDGRLYVGLSADCLTVGFATYASWKRGAKSALETVFRPRFRAHPKDFNRLLERIVRKGRYETYWHRQEKGDWAQHPGLPRSDEDWQTLQAWIVRKVFLPGSRKVSTPAFAAEAERLFGDLYPLYAFTSVAGPKWRCDV
jgi:uncharacterized protein (TIGR02453 family)